MMLVFVFGELLHFVLTKTDSCLQIAFWIVFEGQLVRIHSVVFLANSPDAVANCNDVLLELIVRYKNVLNQPDVFPVFVEYQRTTKL
jgi:hypothetical protein